MHKLPIDTSPSVRAYTYDLFLNAILSANCGNSSLFARFTLEGFSSDKYMLAHTNNSNLIVDGNTVEFQGNKSANNARGTIYQKIGNCKEFIVRVHSHQYNSKWSLIHLFTARNYTFDGENYSNCRVGMFSCNQICCCCDGTMNPLPNGRYNSRNEYCLKITVDNNSISGWISVDGIVWDKLCEHETPNTEELMIGIECSFLPNLYWAWLYSNYVHFSFTEIEDVHVCYLPAPKQYYNYCTFNPLVAFIREQVSFLLYKYDSIVEYIKLNLQRGRYVELYFDEYYVPQMHTYKKEHHLHGDLAYGFDDTHIYFLGLYLGKPFEFKLTYDEVIDGTNSSLEFDANVMLTVYHFNPENYQFSITALYKSLRDYLEGVIDNIEFYNFDSPDHVYDIHALTKLSNDTGLKTSC